MKRLIPGFVAAAVLMAALPAAAQTVPEPGLLRGKPLREYTRSQTAQPWRPTELYYTEATDGDMATRITVEFNRAYRYTWDVPIRMAGIVVVYRMPNSRADLSVYAFDQEGQLLWSQALPPSDSITTAQYDLDLRHVGSLMVYRTSVNGDLYLYELEAYGEPEQVPPPPTGLRARPGDGQVSLSWQPVEGAESYDVEMRPAGGDWQPVAIGLTATTYTVTGLENGQAYDFRVRAVAGGTPGDWSEVVSATPKPLPPWAGLFGGLVAALPAYVAGAVTGIAPIVLIPAAVILAVAVGNWFLGRLHLSRQKV